MAVPPRVYVYLAIGTLVVSQSGNIIRIGEAHPVAIAAWRLGISTVLLTLMAGKQLRALRGLTRREQTLLVFSGIALATHFFAWIAAVQMTTVANAAIFFSTNPVFVAVAAFLIYRERVGWKLVVAIGLGLAGALVIGLDDFDLKPEHLTGDVWAVVCALLFTAYFMLGKRLRRVLPTHAYVTGVYGVAALVGFACLPFLGEPFFDYNGRTWLCFVLMALLPTMIGHTSFNNALHYIRAGWLSAVTLVEPVLAGAVAYFAWGENITGQVAVGYLLICLSVIVLVLDRPSSPKGERT
jgi:drug/metabolite transporter (DMT)-like permease